MAAWNVDALSIIGHRRPKKLIILIGCRSKGSINITGTPWSLEHDLGACILFITINFCIMGLINLYPIFLNVKK